MTMLMLVISTFFGVLFIVVASTTLYMIEHSLQEKSKNNTKKNERRSKWKGNRFGKRAKLENSKSEEPLPEVIVETSLSLEEELEQIDQKLNRAIDIEVCLKELEYLNRKYPNESRIMCMIGKAHERIAYITQDTSIRKYHIDKGMTACQASLEKNYNQSEAHKWIAVLIGLKGETQTTKEKMESGKLFKKHLDIAIDLDSKDPLLQHLAGRFCYEISSLNWIEQKLVNTVFPEPLNCSYDKALEQFLQSERLYKLGWKENRLYISKCYIAKKNYKEAVEWLRKAKTTKDNFSTVIIDEDINNLLQQYSSYK